MISALVVLLGCLIISIVIFGGAQVFIPYFKILLVDILKVSDQDWDSVLSIANSTPGVFGLKLGLVSGYLAANGEWWGWILMILTYLIVVFIPIVIIILIFNKYQKIKTNKFMISCLKIMKPIIAGILISVVINLSMSLIIPFVNFNNLNDYISLEKDNFFIKWRYWMLLGWSFTSIPIDFYLIRKFKINTIYLILINILLCLILFEPWIN